MTKWSYMHMKMIQWYLPAIIIFEMVKMNNNKIGRLNMRYFGILLACLQRKHFEITEISRTGDIKWIKNVWFFLSMYSACKRIWEKWRFIWEQKQVFICSSGDSDKRNKIMYFWRIYYPTDYICSQLSMAFL